MKKRHRRTMRGTVLFTTVSVMALLIIFLTGTLVLASASNSRAHKSYSTSQATYTARAAIDSFVESMVRNGAIAAAVQEVAQPGGSGATSKEIDIVINDPTLGTIGYIDSHGVFQENKMLIENIGGEEYEYINDAGQSLKDNPTATNAKWVKLDRVKITASARVGTEIETVSAYLRKRGGSITTTPNPPTNPSVKGIQMTGSAGFPAGKNITGGLGVNLGNLEANICTKLRNEMSIETSLSFVNSDLVWNTSTTQIYIKESNPLEGQQGYIPYSQTVINGNLYLPNNQFIVLDYDMPEGYQQGSWTNKEVPYVYINGCLVSVSGCSVKQLGDRKNPFNMFVGTYVTNSNNDSLASTNLYMMDEYDGSSYYTVYTDVQREQMTVDGKEIDYDTGSSTATNYRAGNNDGRFFKGDNYLGCAGTTSIKKWTDSISSGSSSTADVGGSVFCNGRLTLANVEIDGDVRIAGDCIIDTRAVIHGDLIVGGTITRKNNAELRVDGEQKQNQGSGGGSTSVENPYVPVENLYVPADTIDMSKMEQLTLDNSYKVNYVKWIPADHGVSAEAPFGVDPWGHAVEQHEQTIYYRWTDETVVDSNTIDSASKLENDIPYSDLANDAEYDTVRSHIADVRYSATTDDPALRVQGSEDGVPYYYGIPTVNGGYIYPSGAVADTNETYYRNTETNVIMSQTAINNYTTVPEHYIRVLSDGITPSGEECGMNKFTYYRNGDDNDFTFDEEAAKTSAPVTATGVYPSSMTRESIYGTYGSSGFTPADPQTKIITTLQEARTALGLSETGEVDTTQYPSVFDGTQEGAPNVSALPTAIENGAIVTPEVFGTSAEQLIQTDIKDSQGNNISFAPITQSCKIKGTVIGDAGRQLEANGRVVIQKDKRKVNGSNDDFKILYFHPGLEDIYVVLEDVKDQENLAFIVDRNANTDGNVYFIIDGTLETGNKMMIIPSYYKAGMEVKYTDDWGITYYGTYNSHFNITNDSTFVGCFRMPYTKFYARVRGQMEVSYVGEDGKSRPSVKPTIVGNALFSGVEVINDFENCYTSTGGSGGGGSTPGSTATFNTEVGYFDIMYMSGS